MKKILNYLLLFLLFAVSIGQILFVFLDGQFEATTFDKISVMIECVPMAYLSLIASLFNKIENSLIFKHLLRIQLVLFVPLTVLRIITIFNNFYINLNYISSIIDTVIIILMFVMILLLINNKKEACTTSVIITILFCLIAIIINALIVENNVVLNASIMLIIYLLSIYPFYSICTA